MPVNWDDKKGWDEYYRKRVEEGERCVDFKSLSLQYIDFCRKRNYSDVWFPGCGTSLAPFAYSFMGFSVKGTDISPYVIAKQRELLNISPKDLGIEKFMDRYLMGKSHSQQKLSFELHDFHECPKEIAFDCILNIRSFQGFSCESQKDIARSHYNALKPGGYAVFEMLEIAHENRKQLEENIYNAGFFIQGYETNRWYRKALNDTGIPYIFVMGIPVISGYTTKKYQEDKEKRKKDLAILQDLRIEYERRWKEDEEKHKKTLQDSETKIANIVYNEE